MLQLQSHRHRLLAAAANFPSSPPLISHSHRLNFHRPSRQPLPNGTVTSASSLPTRTAGPWLAKAPERPAATEASPSEDGPVEFPPSSSIFASSDDPTPLQVATSVLLTGAIAIFLFRSVRRRAKRAKELKFRSSGVKKTSQEDALAQLNAINLASISAKEPPSPVQALLGGIMAGIIAVILFKFTATIEASLNRQAVSDNFSVRQITITVRTIVNGLCYLATCAFGINSVGLILYAGQLALNPTTEASTSEEQLVSSNKEPSSSTTNGAELSGTEGSDDSDSAQ